MPPENADGMGIAKYFPTSALSASGYGSKLVT